MNEELFTQGLAPVRELLQKKKIFNPIIKILFVLTGRK